MYPWTFSYTKDFSQWDFLWGITCQYLQRHVDNFPSYKLPQKHFRKSLNIKPTVTLKTFVWILPMHLTRGESTFLPSYKVLFSSWNPPKYTMVWFYRATTHIWRARCWSQSLNITTAASVWESSMSAVGVVGESRAGEKSPNWFPCEQLVLTGVPSFVFADGNEV